MRKKKMGYKLAIAMQEKDPIVRKIIWKYNFLHNNQKEKINITNNWDTNKVQSKKYHATAQTRRTLTY